MSNVKDSINFKCEEGFKSYLDAQTFSPALPTGFVFLTGISSNNLTKPCCVIAFQDGNETFPDSGVYRMPGNFEIRTKRGDVTAAVHARVAGQIWDELTNPTDIQTLLNKPSSGSDTRTVNSFYIYYSTASSPKYSVEEEGNEHVSTVEMEVVVQGWNHIA